VSKAFTNEDTPPGDDADALPSRQGTFPITPAGLARLQEELASIGASDVGARRARVIRQILESVYVVEPSNADGAARFGAHVTVEDAESRMVSYELVGPDEVDVAAGRISVASPVGQALLGKRAGDRVVVRRPKGDATVTVLSVT